MYQLKHQRHSKHQKNMITFFLHTEKRPVTLVHDDINVSFQEEKDSN